LLEGKVEVGMVIKETAGTANATIMAMPSSLFGAIFVADA
jgi:hypothetical protein